MKTDIESSTHVVREGYIGHTMAPQDPIAGCTNRHRNAWIKPH